MKTNTRGTIKALGLVLLFIGVFVETTFALAADVDPPACRLAGEYPGPPFTIEVSIWDEGSGLKIVNVTKAENATVSIPSFLPGTVSPVLVTDIKIDQNKDWSVTLEATDMAGNTTTCRYPQGDEDIDPPTCELTAESPGPPFSIQITIQDTGSGLDIINVTESENASVSIPSFLSGTVSPVVVTATKIDESEGLSVTLEAIDMAGNVNTCTHSSGDGVVETRPEFDAVGVDSDNFFNDYYKERVIINGRDDQGRRINDFSHFEPLEYFTNTAGELYPDPCFSTPDKEYLSALVPTWTEATYEWQIVLQMKPATDIQLSIVSCVLRTYEVDVWKGAQQTGRYTAPWGQLFFVPTANPRLTVVALPGPSATTGFPEEGFYMDARGLPGLAVVPLVDALYTCEALMEETIVMVLPETGDTSASGQTMYELKQGDRILVTVRVPGNNTGDIHYGSDNVILKYIGIAGTEYSTL